MAKIAYSVSGEGRGHATRVHTIVEALRQQHEVTIYAPRQAYTFLAPLYRETAVSVRRIPGLSFSYKPNRDLSYPRTGWASMHFLAKLPTYIHSLCEDLEREAPTSSSRILSRCCPAPRYGWAYLS
ncbi:MAG TPA: glycosyltransferase family protein [Rhodothermales bacterium]|nr:glycosyltransferase family protein [Rhodothermales bacterium]